MNMNMNMNMNVNMNVHVNKKINIVYAQRLCSASMLKRNRLVRFVFVRYERAFGHTSVPPPEVEQLGSSLVEHGKTMSE